MASQITPLGPAPSRRAPSTFSALMDTRMGEMNTFVTEANTLATEAETDAATAAAAAVTASGAAVSAEASAALASASANVTEWISGTTYAIGDAVWSPTDFLTYRRKTAGAGTDDPSSDLTNWAALIVTTGQSSFVAAGAITAGKAVRLKEDGKVTQLVVSAVSGGTAVTFSPGKALYMSSTFDSVNGKVVICYKDVANSNYGTAVVATVSGTTISFGTPVVFAAEGIIEADCCYDPVGGGIVIAYTGADYRGHVKIGTVAGTSISFGSANIYTSDNATSVSVVYDTVTSRILLCYSGTSNYTWGIVGTISGTTVSFGSTSIVEAMSNNGYKTYSACCASISKCVVAYNRGGTSHSKIVTINPADNSLSFGNSLNVMVGYMRGVVWVSHLNRLVYIGDSGPDSYWYQSVLASVSGTTITGITSPYIDTSGAYSAPYGGFPGLIYDPDAQRVHVAWPIYSSLYGTYKSTTTLTATSMAWGDTVTFRSVATDWLDLAYDSVNGKLIVSFMEDDANDYGRCVVITPAQPNRSTEFLGFAQTTVSNGQTVGIKTVGSVDENQAGLVPSSKYYLSTSDGSTLTTSTNGPCVGKAVSATEILIYGVTA